MSQTTTQIPTETNMRTVITSVHRPDASKRYLDPTTEIDPQHPLLTIPGAEINQAGHDATLVLKNLLGKTSHFIVAVADGHGQKGHLHSYIAIRLLAKQLLSCVPVFLLHLKNIQKSPEVNSLIQQLVTYSYEKVQKLMSTTETDNLPPFPQLDRESGTTMAMALVLTTNGNRYLISTNAGDSQILWSNSLDSEPIQCSMDHNCDNPEAVKIYLERLALKRREIQNLKDTDPDLYFKLHQQLQPRPVYFSRINCGGPVWNMFTDEHGIPAPIKVYDYTGPEKSIPVLNVDGYEKVSTYYPHGTQSRRHPPTYQRPSDGRTVAIKGKEMDNWGSTLQGDSQTLNGFGDTQYYPHHSCKPHVSIHEINSPGKIIVATDGLSDLFYFKELMDWVWKESTSNLEQRFYTYLFDTVAPRDTDYPSIKIAGLDYPKWDDMSGIFVSLGDQNTITGLELFREAYLA